MGKIFGIGLSKTGTTSLNSALEILGYSSVHFPKTLEEIDRNDAATDISVSDMFEYLDEKYPNSKFIYTTRCREKWLTSICAHWQRYDLYRKVKEEILQPPEWYAGLHMRMYGDMRFNREVFVEHFHKYESRVFNYFADRPHDLLVLNICDEAADWWPLCGFLGKPVPEVPFPHDNSKHASKSRIMKRQIWKVVKLLIPKTFRPGIRGV